MYSVIGWACAILTYQYVLVVDTESYVSLLHVYIYTLPSNFPFKLERSSY